MPRHETISIELVPAITDDARALVGELDAVLGQEYAPEQQHGLSVESIFTPGVRFFIARRGDRPIGCGGVALFADFAEVKRMYVRETARGTGAAQAILARLEAEAQGAGLTLLRLETGDQQFAAIAFYERAGFTPCDAFPPYTEMDPYAIATSIFFEKRL